MYIHTHTHTHTHTPLHYIEISAINIETKMIKSEYHTQQNMQTIDNHT